LAGALSMPLFTAIAAGQHPETKPKIDAGKILFDANCSVCHRTSGAGGVHFGAAVSADLRAPGLETTYHDDDALILRATDQDGARLDAPMPAWAGRLSTVQAQDIIAYLHTLHS
jgi:mono/diheme cytochrome c family protein